MSTGVVTPPSSGRPRSMPVGKRMSLADITTKSRGLPLRFVAHGVPGIGKTSFPAFGPKPVYIMSNLETGIEVLLDAGLVPETVARFPECKNWSELTEAIRVLTEEEHEFKTVVVDTINGCEKMCHEIVCQRDYNSHYASFAAYQSGFKVAVGDWRLFLGALDKLRETRRMGIWLLAHTKVVNFKNPSGADYDRYSPDMNPETWSVTHGWADCVLFLNHDVDVDARKGQQKGKAQDNQRRLIYTTRTAAYDAKNRHNLPEIISMGDSGKEAWANFSKEMIEAKKGGAA